ncbi:MAG TPA: membrane dipeptidase [Chitinophagaceae bacterium]|jgi:microsomal dipeptidase-like Zn-dependent dipeptidase|nr:membrane dipeptidase [Chitinophagaceae bacterium]
MPFFDFHLHPSLKPQMSLPPGFPSPWELIKIKFNHPNIITALLKCSGINEVVDSQASLSQLVKGKVNLIALALHPPETAMMNDGLIQQIAAEEQTNYINLSRITDIGSGDIYFRMLNEELANLKKNLSNNGKKLKLISNISQYKASDTDTVHAILIIEGPHAFFGPKQHRTETEIFTDFWNNFETFTTANRIFSLNIAHLQDNEFSNHAFGIQIFKPKPFYPRGNGISQHGFKLLQKMKEKDILLDIKHMSLYARKQLYDFRIGETDWPIVCTHAGLTGIKKEDRGRYFIEQHSEGDHLRVRHYKPAGYILGTSFNPCTINLYDEDVREVVFSGGLIGLSLDQRILGTPEEWMMSSDNMGDIYEEEVISPGEKDFFMNVVRSTPNDSDIIKPTDIIPEDRQDWLRFHARHFMNQVFHLFKIADQYNYNKALMAQRICIGSDFDGMINPVDCCKNVTQLEKFRNYLTDNFKEWEKDFTEVTGIKTSSFITPKKLMENIFYQNGVDFLKEWYV